MLKNLSAEDLLNHLQAVLAESFDLPAAQVQLQAHLKDDLGLDSIDAVDLIMKIREITGLALTPRTFKDAQTVAEVIAIIQAHQASV